MLFIIPTGPLMSISLSTKFPESLFTVAASSLPFIR